MAKNKVTYTYPMLEQLIRDANDRRTVVAIVVIAMGQYGEKKLSDFAFAGLLRKASDRIYEIYN